MKAVACGAVFTIAFFVFGPIAIVIPIFFLSRTGDASSAKFTQKWAVGWVLATIVFASVSYLFIRETDLYETFLREILDWRVFDTMASRGLMSDETKSRYPITMELFSGILILGMVIVFGPKRGSFSDKVNSNIRSQIHAHRASRVKIFGLSLFFFLGMMFLFYVGSPRISRQLSASVLYPAFSILTLLAGAAIIYCSKEGD